jgi:hypothetical protein
MQTPTDMDLLRAYAAGTLDASRRAALEARLRAEPDLAALLEAWREVAAAPAEDVPACEVPFEALRLDPADVDAEHGAPVGASRRLWTRPAFAIAACALLAVGGAALWATSRGTGGGEPPAMPADVGPVRLAAIPKDPVEVPVLPAVPAVLADYRPANDRGLVFAPDLAAARGMARATSRPMLAFVYHPTCPLCVEYQKGPFTDPAVREAAQPFVLAKVNVMEAERGMQQALESAGWPAFLLYRVDESGETKIHAFGDYHEAKELAGLLTDAAKKSATSSKPAPLPWDAVNALARDLAAADAEADPAKRTAEWTRISRADPSGGIGAVARSRLAKQKEAARVALRAAQDAAGQGDLRAAAVALDAALPTFAGTPYETDLRHVHDRLARDSAFPEIVFAPEAPQ